MIADSGIASDVARAIGVANDWSSSPESRNTALAFLESFKVGDIQMLVSISFILVKKDFSTEIRLHAFKMLQHLVRTRWDELSASGHQSFAVVAMNVISDISNPCEDWALKSQSASLVAEMVKREGVDLWKELLPSIVSLSNTGTGQAELVSMILRWLPEDITVHNEDLEGGRLRLLLQALTESLPEILPLLYTSLSRHFESAASEAGLKNFDSAKQHASVVASTLKAINAYAEWAPLNDLSKYGIIYGCSCLLSSPDFRISACEFFKLVSSRKITVDASDSTYSECLSTMNTLFQILTDVTKEFLYKCSISPTTMDESEVEFAECMCESMVSLGTLNFKFIFNNKTLLPFYIQQMLSYFQHFKLSLHYTSIPFWLVLLRECILKPKVITPACGDSRVLNSSTSHYFGNSEEEKMLVVSLITDSMCETILQTSCRRIIRKEKLHSSDLEPFGDLELWSDDFEEKGDFSQYRSMLMNIIKLIATWKPLVTVKNVSDLISTIINSPLPPQVVDQDIAIMESTEVVLVNVIASVFGGYSELVSDPELTLCEVVEGLLQQLLALKWTEPTLAKLLAQYLEAFGPYLNKFPNSTGNVISKLFDLLTSIPTVIKDPPTNTARHARLHICTSFVRIAKSADKSLLPHMKGIIDTMTYLKEKGSLLQSEHNILGEVCLVVASATGFQKQLEVLAWLLEPFSKQWTQPEWQNIYLYDPIGIIRLCMERKIMWSIYHTVVFFEKALKRSKVRDKYTETAVEKCPILHPMASHLSWIIPPLLNLLHAIHSLWSPQLASSLPGCVKSAMVVTHSSEGGQIEMNNSSEFNENDLRNWLKAVRESGYNAVGLSLTTGVTFFKFLNADSFALALMENIQEMEFRHIRLLLHNVLIPLVKFCPADMWEIWLEKPLRMLFLHMEQALTSSWFCLIVEGRAKVPDSLTVFPGSDLKIEVMEEKILRDITREVCSLLDIMSSPELNSGVSLETFGHSGRDDMTYDTGFDASTSSSVIRFLLEHRDICIPALKIGAAAFTWTDGESVSKVSSFCSAVIQFAVLTNNPELREFAARDLFQSIIQGLSLETNSDPSNELIGLCRDIFVHLADKHPAPRQVLLSLPHIKPEDLKSFEESLAMIMSPKEQKQHLKSLLLLSTGDKLKALISQKKKANKITNVTRRERRPKHMDEEEGPLGLSSIM